MDGSRRTANNEDGTYEGEYEYEHDPNHKKHIGEPGWHLTKRGESRGTDKKDGGPQKPTKVIPYRPLIAVPSTELRHAVLENSKNAREFVTSGFPDFQECVDEVVSRYGNHRMELNDVNNLIIDFADKKMKEAGHILSTYLAYRHNLSPDFRVDTNNIPRYDKRFAERLDKYIRREQEIISKTGLVNEDGTITLFRNTDEHQADFSSALLNDKIQYKGNNLESLTTNIDLNWNTNGRHTKKVMAKIPLYACIASCVGRNEKPFMTKKQCEIMVCGAFIPKVRYVGSDGVDIPEIYENYIENTKENMERFANENQRLQKDKKASVLELEEQILNLYEEPLDLDGRILDIDDALLELEERLLDLGVDVDKYLPTTHKRKRLTDRKLFDNPIY